MLIFAGTCDQVVPDQGIDEMADIAQRVGAPFETFLTPMASTVVRSPRSSPHTSGAYFARQ
jgi:hypothetical protein